MSFLTHTTCTLITPLLLTSHCSCLRRRITSILCSLESSTCWHICRKDAKQLLLRPCTTAISCALLQPLSRFVPTLSLPFLFSGILNLLSTVFTFPIFINFP